MSQELREIALDSIITSPLNVRKDLSDLTGLIDSITAAGILEPMVVRPIGEEYEVIAGNRRVEVARYTGHTRNTGNTKASHLRSCSVSR